MNKKQETMEKKFNSLFTSELLRQYNFYFLKNVGHLGAPTQNGHGPFVETDQGSVVYDLRDYSQRWIYGNSHPLEIRSRVNHQVKLNQYPTEKKVIINCTERLKNCYAWEYPVSYLQQNINVPDGFQIIKASLLNINELQNHIDSWHQIVPVIHLTQSECLIHKDKIKKLFNIFKQNKVSFGVIEENTLGLSSQEFMFTNYTSNRPDYLATNYNLRSYICWCNTDKTFESEFQYKNGENINKNFDERDLDIFHSFTNYLYGANIFGESGYIQKLSNYISEAIAEFHLTGIKQNSLQISLENKSSNLNDLLRNGIMAYKFNDQVCCNFPLSLKKEHVMEVFQILKQQEK